MYLCVYKYISIYSFFGCGNTLKYIVQKASAISGKVFKAIATLLEIALAECPAISRRSNVSAALRFLTYILGHSAQGGFDKALSLSLGGL